jgi:hypothetical protein
MACVIQFTALRRGGDTARACNRTPRGMHSDGAKNVAQNSPRMSWVVATYLASEYFKCSGHKLKTQ